MARTDQKLGPRAYPVRDLRTNDQVVGRVVNPPRVGTFGTGTGRIWGIGKSRVAVGPVSDRGKGV